MRSVNTLSVLTELCRCWAEVSVGAGWTSGCVCGTVRDWSASALSADVRRRCRRMAASFCWARLAPGDERGAQLTSSGAPEMPRCRATAARAKLVPGLIVRPQEEISPAGSRFPARRFAVRNEHFRAQTFVHSKMKFSPPSER